MKFKNYKTGHIANKFSEAKCSGKCSSCHLDKIAGDSDYCADFANSTRENLITSMSILGYCLIEDDEGYKADTSLLDELEEPYENDFDLLKEYYNKIEPTPAVEIKPCPCCGGRAVIRYKGENGYWKSNVYIPNISGMVECTKCFIRTKDHGKVKNAIKCWNTRCDDLDG